MAARSEGYQSDITRTFVLGKATDKMKTVFDIVHRAQRAALAAARPGVPLESVDAAARKVVVDAGYGPGFKYFSHRVGHGMGMDGHEWPYLVKNNMFGWDQGADAAAGHGVQRRAGRSTSRASSVCVSRTTCTSRRTAPSCSRRRARRSRSRSQQAHSPRARATLPRAFQKEAAARQRLGGGGGDATRASWWVTARSRAVTSRFEAIDDCDYEGRVSVTASRR